MGTAGDEGVQAEGIASECPETNAEGKWGLQGGEGQGWEGHPPCTFARGLGTPARSSRTASGSASCSPCGRRLHGWGKRTHQQLFQKREGREEGFPISQEVASPQQSASRAGIIYNRGCCLPHLKVLNTPKIRTSNEEPHFSVLILTPDSVSRLMKLFQGSCPERQNSNQVQIKSIYRSCLG